MLDFDLFRRVVDEVGPSLVRIDFFNYGEAFLHKRAVEMCEYIKSHVPAHLSLHEHERPGADRGAGAAPRALRHRRGHLLDRRRHAGQLREIPAARQVRRGHRAPLRAMADEKRRAGRDLPFLNWRYILFVWNDSDEEMNEARRLAADIGVDRLCWEITDHPEDALLAPVRPGLAGARADPSRNLGRQQPGQRHSRRHAAARIDVDGVPGRAVPLLARAGGRCRCARACTISRPGRSRRRPATAGGSCGSARSSATPDGALIDRDFARVAARTRSARAAAPTSRSTSRRRRTRGRYTLKFDLVSEGIDWFERCGSQTTTRVALGR